MTVLDVGAGSGILSIASVLLGARRVVACDVDPVAVEIAEAACYRANARVMLFNGSAGALRSWGAAPIPAHISAPAALQLAPQFLRCLAPGGRCVASGFEIDERMAVEDAIRSASGMIESKTNKGQWCALIVTAAKPQERAETY